MATVKNPKILKIAGLYTLVVYRKKKTKIPGNCAFGRPKFGIFEDTAKAFFLDTTAPVIYGCNKLATIDSLYLQHWLTLC